MIPIFPTTSFFFFPISNNSNFSYELSISTQHLSSEFKSQRPTAVVKEEAKKYDKIQSELNARISIGSFKESIHS